MLLQRPSLHSPDGGKIDPHQKAPVAIEPMPEFETNGGDHFVFMFEPTYVQPLCLITSVERTGNNKKVIL